MLRYGWFQPKQTNKQTINHRYTIYGIEKKQSQQNNGIFSMGFFQRDFMFFFFTGYKTNFRMVDLNGISPPTIGI
jgi:predicted metalloprotease with PDZ domain